MDIHAHALGWAYRSRGDPWEAFMPVTVGTFNLNNLFSLQAEITLMQVWTL